MHRALHLTLGALPWLLGAPLPAGPHLTGCSCTSFLCNQLPWGPPAFSPLCRARGQEPCLTHLEVLSELSEQS